MTQESVKGEDIDTEGEGEGDGKDHRCGWLCFSPLCMVKCGSPPFLLFFLCGYFIVNQSVISGVFSPSISTIEKRFSLSSSQMGFIASVYDIAPLIFAGPISYFGTRHRSRWLGGGMLTMGLAYFIFILPHLMIEKYQPAVGLASSGNSSSLPSFLCRSSSGLPTKCVASSKDSNMYYRIFTIAMFLAGIGGTPMLSLGIPFLDDSIHPKKSPMYVGIFSASGVIAVVIGFTMTYFSLQVFVNPSVPVTITHNDFGQWIGAWWLGFVIGIVMAVIVGIGLLAFPNELQNAKVVRKQLQNEITEQQRVEEPNLTLRELPKILKEIFINHPAYLFVVIFSSLEFFQVSAITVFLPKMMSLQFRVSPVKISLTFGIIGVVAATIGTLGGSYIQQRFKLGCIGALKFTTFASFIAMLLECYLFIYCDSSVVAGVNTAYINRAPSLVNQCNQNCSCAQGSFVPVCANALTYATPCFAGCTKKLGGRLFSNCTCMTRNSIATLGTCPVSCGSMQYAYYALFFMSSCILCLYITPVTIAILRCVPSRMKTFAVGIQSIFIRILGSIPGPIFFGYMIDKSCIYWNRTCDNQRGSCHLYDNRMMAVTVGMTTLILKAIGTLSIFIAWQLYKRKSITKDDEETTGLEERVNVAYGACSTDDTAVA